VTSWRSSSAIVVHIGVMDAAFCPPFTAGPPIVKAIPSLSSRTVT